MKRLMVLMLCVVLMGLCLPVISYAAECRQEVIHYEDGSYVSIELTINGMRTSGNVTGSKKYTYYNSDGISQWRVVLTGNFTYTGSNATCTAASVDVTIDNSSWYIGNKMASKSDNKAKASVTMKITNNNVTATIPANLTLACDSNGNLS